MTRNNGKKPLGRPRVGDAAKLRGSTVDVYMRDDDKQVFADYVNALPAPHGRKRVSMSEAAAAILLRAAKGDEEPTRPEIPILGHIPAGPAKEVVYARPGAMVRPPFDLKPGAYALVVYGDSMESEYGVNIPHGSYAFFSPNVDARLGDIVHVEWPRDKDGGEHYCTIKRFNPQSDGTVDFTPLNASHKIITRREGEYVIKGVFLRAWEGESISP